MEMKEWVTVKRKERVTVREERVAVMRGAG
jgi:hypothetical protein